METLLESQTPPGRWDHVKLEIVQGAQALGKGDGCEQREKKLRLFPCFYINFLIHCFLSDSGHFGLPIKYFNENYPTIPSE